MLKILNSMAAVAAVALVVSLSGCGGGASDVPDLGQVTGQVTLDGEPLPNAKVRFQPPDGRSSEGVTNASGEYTLQYNIGLSGAKVGPNDVFITTATEGTLKTVPGDDDGEWTEGAPELVPAKYLQPGTLTAEVKAGSNTFDFALESK